MRAMPITREAVRCPYPHGGAMKLITEDRGTCVKYNYACSCGARSPSCTSEDAAYAAAMQRYAEPNRVLTLEEASQKLEAIEPIYIEICGFGGGKWFSNGDDIIEAVSSRIKTPDIDEYYGTEWRAWLRRPTDAEREAVEWDSGNG